MLILAISLPLVIPRLRGYEIYNVVSGSMAPAIPTGSIVYVTPAVPAEVEPGEVIAYADGDAVVVHRVTANYPVEAAFTTKGDANNVEDLREVSYSSLRGIVVFHLPVLGRLSALYTSAVGKIYALGFAVVAMLFYILSGQLRELAQDIGNAGRKKPVPEPEPEPKTDETTE